MVIAMLIGFIVLHFWTHNRNQLKIKSYGKEKSKEKNS